MKANLKKMFQANSFARGVAVLSSGTVGAQILLLLAAPILTRLYSPEDFGVLAVFVSVLSILGVIAALRYELAIPVVDDDETALNIAALCLLITVVMAVLTAFIVWSIGDWGANLLGITDYANYLWLLPIGVVLIGFYQTFNYWATREKAFSRISTTKLMQSISSLIIQFSFFKLGPLGLVCGYITGQFMGAGKLSKSALRQLSSQIVSIESVRNVASRYRRYPIFASWSGIFNTVGLQLAPLLFAGFFGPVVAGWFALANRIVHSPASLFGAAIGNVFFAHAADARRRGELGTLVQSTQQKLIAISLPPAMIVFLFGQDIFVLVFGKEWFQAGIFAQWLILSSLTGFLVSSVSMIFSVLERQALGLVLQSILFSFRLMGLVIGILRDDYLLAIILFSLGGAAGYLLYLIAITKCVGTDGVRLCKACVVQFMLSALIMLPVFLLKHSSVGFELFSLGLLFTVLALLGYYYYTLRSFLRS